MEHCLVDNRNKIIYIDFDNNRDAAFSDVASFVRDDDRKDWTAYFLNLVEGEIFVGKADAFIERINHFASYFGKSVFYNSNVILKDMFEYDKYPSISKVEMYPYGLLNRTKWLESIDQGIKKYRKTQVTKHFICMNGAAKFYRAKLYNDLIGHGLEGISHISWMNRYGPLPEKVNERLPNVDINLIKTLDVDDLDAVGGTQDVLTKFYSDAAIDLFVESVSENNSVIFPTEKTWKPVMVKKPFLGFSSKGYYEWMKSEDFVLYEELFDYGFDAIEDNEERYKSYFDNIIRISSMDISDLNDLISKLEDKLTHNRIVAKSKNYIPHDLEPFSQNTKMLWLNK